LLKQTGLVWKQATQWTYENGTFITQGAFITLYTDYVHIPESFCNVSQCNKIYIPKKLKLVGR